MLEFPDEVLQKLAFQRGVLTLIKENSQQDPMIERALEQLDSLMNQIF